MIAITEKQFSGIESAFRCLCMSPNISFTIYLVYSRSRVIEPVASMQIRWLARQMREADGLVPFIDFVRARLFRQGRLVEMRNGILKGLFGTMEVCLIGFGN